MTEEQKQTLDLCLAEVHAIRTRLEKFSKLSLAQELAVTVYVEHLNIDNFISRLEKQEEVSRSIRATERFMKISDAIRDGKPIPYLRKRRRRRARRQRPTTND